MSVIDTVVNAIAPHENKEAQRQARAKAKSVAKPGDWLSCILEHHENIETAFALIKAASTAGTRTAAQARLAALLTGHANAEESVIYPAMSRAGGQGHATQAYSEQATAKTELACLETLAPMSAEYLQKLEHLQDAVAHHVYEEESSWFLDLKANASPQEQATLARRYQEEFERYVGRTERHDVPDRIEPVEGVTTQHRMSGSAVRPTPST